jgi:hypothetical protein
MSAFALALWTLDRFAIDDTAIGDADPECNEYHDGSLVEMARERGHEGVARLLEDTRQRMGRVAPGPPVLTGCQGYLLEHTDMLRTLLAHGMSPGLMNWQPDAASPRLSWTGYDRRRRRTRAVLLDAGAHISAR